MTHNVRDILDAARSRAADQRRQKLEDMAASTPALEDLAAALEQRVAPRLEAARQDWRSGVRLQVNPHLNDDLETAKGPAISIRLVGGQTSTGGAIGTDVFIISHPEDDRFEVRRLSSGKLINEEIGWPLRGAPTQQHIDALLTLVADEFFRTRQSFS